jgi:hypothetical protein
MRIEAPPHAVELNITEIVPSNLPSAGDLRVEIRASVNEFVGWVYCCSWVDAEAFKPFAASVERLYASFEGTAELNSMSTGEFLLTRP